MRFLLFLVAILISPYVGWTFALASGQEGSACVIGMSTTYTVAGLISALVITTTVVKWKTRWDVLKAILGWLTYLGFQGLLLMPKYLTLTCR